MGVALEWALIAAFVGMTTPSPPPSHPVPLSVPVLLERAAIRYGLSAQRLKRIAACESSTGTNPRAYSWSTPHRGVMQISRQTFQWAAPRAGYPADWALAFDDAVNIDVAGWIIANPAAGGGWQHWSCG